VLKNKNDLKGYGKFDGNDLNQVERMTKKMEFYNQVKEERLQKIK